MSRAYYNEIDKDKAEWLREVIKAGLAAPGDVDERSISDVRADDLRGYSQCHFFAGIGVWSYALRLAGWPDDRPVWTGSCPCPSFSCAGKGGGFDDPRHLWPHWARLIRECHPASIFGEQVDAAIGHGWIDLVQVEMEAEEYAIGKASLNSAGYGGYDIRQRLYFVAHSQRDRRSGPWQHSEPMHPAENSYREAGGLFDAVRWGALPYVCRRHDRDPSGMVQMRGYGDAINPWVAKAFIEACNF
jgi:DNA (cytosine-5)-methyltransferase 1